MQLISSVERVLGIGLPSSSTHQQYSPDRAHWTGLNSPTLVHWGTNTPGAADPDQARTDSLSLWQVLRPATQIKQKNGEIDKCGDRYVSRTDKQRSITVLRRKENPYHLHHNKAILSSWFLVTRCHIDLRTSILQVIHIALCDKHQSCRTVVQTE